LANVKKKIKNHPNDCWNSIVYNKGLYSLSSY